MTILENVRPLGLYFTQSDGKLSIFRENNKPESAMPIVGVEEDCDGWSHAWFFPLDQIAKGENAHGWHFQFDGVTFDKCIEDAVMNSIKFDGALTITEENSGSNVDFVEIGFELVPPGQSYTRYTQLPFEELPYKFDELPKKIQSVFQILANGVSVESILQSFVDARKTACQKASFEQADASVDKAYSGKVMGVTDCHVVLSLGRTALIVAQSDLDRVPEQGEEVAVTFKGGKGMVQPGKGRDQEVER